MKVRLYYANWHALSRIPDSQETFMAVAQLGEVLLDDEFYDHVHSCEMNSETALDACNETFERFNFGDRGGHKVRSMSVGDVVHIDYALWQESYVCQPDGWRKFNSKEVGLDEQ